jgi:SagB-type dehydrogenase family enzyme
LLIRFIFKVRIAGKSVEYRMDASHPFESGWDLLQEAPGEESPAKLHGILGLRTPSAGTILTRGVWGTQCGYRVREVFIKESEEEGQRGRGIGERFHEETKYTAGRMGYGLDWQSMPEPYKNYASPIGTIALPGPLIGQAENVWEVFGRRRSTRAFSSERSLSLGLLSSLLWSTQGITGKEGEWYFRAAPSAGALYPIETYILARAVEGLEQGIYHFRPHLFDLEFIKSGNFAPLLAEAALGQEMIREAQTTFIWTAIVARSTWKYRQRAYRYIYMDAGHIAQNLYLAGTAAGLGVCAVGAFFDDQVNGLIGIDGVEEITVYLASVGGPRTVAAG